MSRILSPNLESALGWTVVHSLWQATAIALLVAVLMIALRKKSAQTRYLVSCTGLFATLVAAIITFCFYFDFSYQISGIRYQVSDADLQDKLTVNSSEVITGSSKLIADIGFKDYFNQHLPLIVSVWLMGVALFTLRLLSGVSYVAYLKRYRNAPMKGDWQARVEFLCEQLGVTKAVEIFESALVKTPMTVGSLKPIILFPLGAVAGLSSEQMEAILAHELAHILRKDYFFNIVQSIVEILFYFHPAVWWLSNTIRNERENCCDDIAVSISGNSLSYAKALVNLQELHAHSPILAMGFSGKNSKNQLLNRVKRLLNQPQTKSNIMEKLVATCFLLLVLALTSFSENRKEESGISNQVSGTDGQNIETTDSSKSTNSYKDGLGTFTYIDDKENVKWQMRDGEIVQLNINGKEITEKEFPKYYASLKKWKTSIPELISDSLPKTSFGQYSDLTFKDGKNKYHYVVENDELTKLSINGKEIPKEDFGKYTEFLKKKNAFYPPPPPLPGIPEPPPPPSPSIWSSDKNGNAKLGANSYSYSTNTSVDAQLAENSKAVAEKSRRMEEQGKLIALNSMRIANQSLKNLHINVGGDNLDEGDGKCDPCDDERSDLKNQLKDLISKAQLFDTDDAKDVAFYNKKAAQLKDIKRRLNNSGIQSDEINKIRNEMRKMREEIEEFDDNSEELYPNKKTKYGWQAGFEAELLKDGLIQDANHYSIGMFTGDDQIIINNDQKNRQVFLKYQALYERLTGSKLRRANHLEYSKGE